LLRQIEQAPELPVPARQAEVGIKNTDSLIDLIKGGLQQVPIVLKCLRGVIQQTYGGFFGGCMLLQQQRNNQSGRGRSNGACQQLFGMGNKVVACQFAGVCGAAVLFKIGIERPFGSFNAQVVGDRVFQIGNRDRLSVTLRNGACIAPSD